MNTLTRTNAFHAFLPIGGSGLAFSLMLAVIGSVGPTVMSMVA